jgi:hypothetical protein
MNLELYFFNKVNDNTMFSKISKDYFGFINDFDMLYINLLRKWFKEIRPQKKIKTKQSVQ